jgi:ankyrin repeat protein
MDEYIEDIKKRTLKAFKMLREMYYYSNSLLTPFLELLKQGIDVNLKDYTGETILLIASQYCPCNIISLLIDNNANVNDQDSLGCTSLMYAVYRNSYDTVLLLIEKKADVKKRESRYGLNALMIAVENKSRYDIALLLIKNGANLEERNREGYTCLMHSIRFNNFDASLLLIKNGANIYACNERNGATFLSILSNCEESDEKLAFISSLNKEILFTSRKSYLFLSDSCQNDNGHIVHYLFNEMIIREICSYSDLALLNH